MARGFPYRPDVQAATSSSYDGDGFLSLGVDGDATETNLPPAEALQPLGLLARPVDPGTDGAGNVNQGKAPNVLRLIGENTDYAIPLGDPRIAAALPQVGKGGLCLYEPSLATDLARITLNGDDQHGIVVHVRGDQPTQITLELGGGPTVVLDGTTTPPQVRITAGPNTLIVDENFIQAGAAGGQFVVVNPDALTGSFTALQGLLAGIGLSWAPPVGIAATRMKAT